MQDLDQYLIRDTTLALVPMAHEKYRTMILDYRGKYYSTKTPKQLLDEACWEDCCTYNGRRQAVTNVLRIIQKVPIPVSPHKNIYAFPTTSPDQFECIWIFANHIKESIPHKKQETIIYFKNYEKILVPVSIYVIKEQVKRTSLCVFHFTIQNKISFWLNSRNNSELEKIDPYGTKNDI